MLAVNGSLYGLGSCTWHIHVPACSYYRLWFLLLKRIEITSNSDSQKEVDPDFNLGILDQPPEMVSILHQCFIQGLCVVGRAFREWEVYYMQMQQSVFK